MKRLILTALLSLATAADADACFRGIRDRVADRRAERVDRREVRRAAPAATVRIIVGATSSVGPPPAAGCPGGKCALPKK